MPLVRQTPKRVLWVAGIVILAGCILLGWYILNGSASSDLDQSDTDKSMTEMQKSAVPIAAAGFQPLSKDEAIAENEAVPIAALPNPSARPFLIGQQGTTDYSRALYCLTSAIYYEAATEPIAGQEAVAQVILNRVRHPAFPATICGVTFQGWTRSTGCQFTFTCDGSMARTPSVGGWERARTVAAAALAGKVASQVGLATHYHANYVVPYWAPKLVKTAVLGAHIFYRWGAGWSAPNYFTRRYPGGEPDHVNLAATVTVAIPDGEVPIEAIESQIQEVVAADSGVATPPDGQKSRTVLRADLGRTPPLADSGVGVLLAGGPGTRSKGETQREPLGDAADEPESCDVSKAKAQATSTSKSVQPVTARVGSAC